MAHGDILAMVDPDTTRHMTYYLTVLDFTTGTTHIYKLYELQTPQDDQIEAHIESLGHKVSDCEWMLATNIKIEI